MIYKVKIISFFLLLTMSNVYAQKAIYAIDLVNKKCYENSMLKIDVAIVCEQNALTSWENEIKLYLKLLEKKENQINIVLLNKSQKKWKAFYKADIKLYNSYINK